MEYLIIKTNLFEITFLDGKVKDVFCFAGHASFEVEVKPKDIIFTFEVTDKLLPDPNIIERVFKAPYCTVSGTEVQMTQESIDMMRATMNRRNKEVKKATEDSNNTGSLFVFINKDGSVSTQNTMPARHLAKTIMILAKRDPNFSKALNEEMLEDSMEKLQSALGRAF